MNILFIEWAYKGEPYNLSTLQTQAVGGSESTLINIATELAKSHKVYINQMNLVECYEDHQVNFITNAEMERLASQNVVDVCIVMRKIKQLGLFIKLFKQSRILLWAHDFLAVKSIFYNSKIIQNNCRVVAVSLTHQGHCAAAIRNEFKRISSRNAWIKPADWPVSFVYNPIADALKPDATPVDKNKLVFFSSPHKGLSQVLENFRAAREKIPQLKILIANPGYRSRAGKKAPMLEQQLQMPGVELIGSLPQHEIIQHVRSALCVFYPQSVFPETFGLIYAEANAVGTPVLAHDFGSASELLDQSQLVDANNQKQVVDKLITWHQGARPVVQLESKFRLTNVVKQWDALLTRFC